MFPFQKEDNKPASNLPKANAEEPVENEAEEKAEWDDDTVDELKDDFKEMPLKEVIEAILTLPAKDLQQVYTAIGKVIKGVKKEVAPKAEAAPEDQFNAQDMARSFM